MSADLRLSALESEILAFIVSSYPEFSEALSAQIAGSRISSRKTSADGFFLRFEGADPDFPQRNAIFEDVHAELEGLERPVGFILFMRDGRLSLLEGFTYAEEWPQEERIRRVYFQSTSYYRSGA